MTIDKKCQRSSSRFEELYASNITGKAMVLNYAFQLRDIVTIMLRTGLIRLIIYHSNSDPSSATLLMPRNGNIILSLQFPC